MGELSCLPALARTKLIVFQPTPFCNIDCSYCYLPHRTNTSRASLSSIRGIFASVLRFPTVKDQVSVVWHAGEPLTMGPSYFAEAFQIISDVKPVGLKVSHSIQTNGTLISREFSDLFLDWDVNVGISIDGPEDIHNQYRTQRNGRGTFKQALQGAYILRDRGVPFYVLTVLTDASIDKPTEMFRFFHENSFYRIAFNIEEIESDNETSSLAAGDYRDRYKGFIREFWKKAAGSGKPFSVREVEKAVSIVRDFGINRRRDSFDPAHANDQVVPFRIISISANGDLATFSPELLSAEHRDYSTFIVGNSLTHSFEELAASPLLRRIEGEIRAGLQKCQKECGYWLVCGGGSPANKLFENGTFRSTETMYCQLNHMSLIDLALEWVDCYRTASNEADHIFMDSMA